MYYYYKNIEKKNLCIIITRTLRETNLCIIITGTLREKLPYLIKKQLRIFIDREIKTFSMKYKTSYSRIIFTRLPKVKKKW